MHGLALRIDNKPPSLFNRETIIYRGNTSCVTNNKKINPTFCITNLNHKIKFVVKITKLRIK